MDPLTAVCLIIATVPATLAVIYLYDRITEGLDDETPYRD